MTPTSVQEMEKKDAWYAVGLQRLDTKKREVEMKKFFDAFHQPNDGFPRMWFDQMADTFVTNYPASYSVSGYNAKHWCYSTFQVHLIFVSENGLNTALIIYEAGGSYTGVTGKEFFEKYNSK